MTLLNGATTLPPADGATPSSVAVLRKSRATFKASAAATSISKRYAARFKMGPTQNRLYLQAEANNQVAVKMRSNVEFLTIDADRV